MQFFRRRRQNSDSSTSIKKTSRKPPNTAFKQQRLKSWQPILTPKTVIPFLFLIALVFAPLGVAILFTTYHVQQLTIDYSKCDVLANTDSSINIPKKYVDFHFKSKLSSSDFPKWKLINQTDDQGDSYSTCQITFTTPNEIQAPIFLYYKLTNFYQNHRKYVQSYDLNQIKGKAVSSGNLDTYCSPFKTNSEGKIYYPCGLIANSFFNDTFYSPVLLNAQSSSNNETYEMTDKDISWKADQHKFKKTKYNVSDIVPPPNWSKLYPDGYTEENLPDLSEWESLQNWMRTAGLPKFMKLALKNTTQTLASGTYSMNVDMHYPVSIFGGTKSVVITSNSIFGGRNLALGIIYIIIAAISILLSIGFLVQHLIKPRRIGDHNYLNNNVNSEITTFRDQL